LFPRTDDPEKLTFTLKLPDRSKSPRVGRGHDFGNYFKCVSMEIVFKNLLNNY
jgi:hypothetical protein